MYRFMLYALIAIGSVLLLFAILLFSPHIFNRIAPVRHNDDFPTETNRAIISLVNQLMQIDYGQFDRDVASAIFADELFEQVDSERGFTHIREHTLFFRIIDRDYMQTLSRIASNDYGETLYRLRVRVYGGLIDDHRLRRIHWITIMRSSDDLYVIVDIEYDR